MQLGMPERVSSSTAARAASATPLVWWPLVPRPHGRIQRGGLACASDAEHDVDTVSRAREMAHHARLVGPEQETTTKLRLDEVLVDDAEAGVDATCPVSRMADSSRSMCGVV